MPTPPSRFRSPLVTTVLAVALLSPGCGGDPKPTTKPGAEAVASTKAGFKFSTGKFEIKPGDTFECFYTDTITSKPMNVNSASGKQGPGGHHLVVYYTDQKVTPGHHPCTDIEMVGLKQIAGAGDGSEGIVALPPGFATRVPEGKQLVVQAHYIRTESTPTTVEDEIELATLEDSEVKELANSFVMVDGSFKLPPRAASKSVTDCEVPRDLQLLLLLGHMHEWGAHYKLERVDDKGNPTETLYETDWDPLYASHPPVTSYASDKRLLLPKGSHIRQTCEWKNTEDHEMAFPREMCVMFSYYAPDEGWFECDTKVVK